MHTYVPPSTYVIETATPDTLADTYALYPDPAQAAGLLGGLRERVAAGQIRPEQFLILRSERGVEATVLIAANARVPLFPRYRPDAPADALTAFFRRLREEVKDTPSRPLLLDDSLVLLRPTEAQAAGWVLDSTTVLYQTDLSSLSSPPDPAIRPIVGGEVGSHEVQELLVVLNRADFDPEAGDQLLGLRNPAGHLVGLGRVTASNRAGWANLDLIGVHPAERGQGYGQRLHAQMLACAAPHFSRHGGQTDADNHAMRRIYAANGSQQTGTQLYFKT